VINVRNRLVHPQPQTVSSEQPHDPEAKLHGKFPTNKLQAHNNPSWPGYYLGHGMTKWAHTAVVAFTDTVIDALGISPIYRQRGDLWSMYD